MADAYIPATVRSADLEVAVAVTTNLCRDARKAHGLAPSSAIALGRLLTAAALVTVTSKRRGTTSLQIISRGRFRQIFADANHEGDLRGFVRKADLDLPVLDESERRRGVSLALLPGKLSVVRSDDTGQFTQSTTDLVSGEIDLDVEHFLAQSDQIPTVLECDVLPGPGEEIEAAGGVIVQALPGGNLERLAELRATLHAKKLIEALRAHPHDAPGLLKAILPEAVPVDHPRPLQWRCRCSHMRVLGALRMLSPTELAEMVQEKEATQVGCELCGASYTVEPDEITQLFLETVKAEG